MKLKITAKNYRCFTERDPLVFEIGQGESIAFIGVNNAGKSNPHRFIYEMQSLWAQLESAYYIANGLNGSGDFFIKLKGVSDSLEIFNYNNDRDIILSLDIIDNDDGVKLKLSNITLKILRKIKNPNELQAELIQVCADGVVMIPLGRGYGQSGTILTQQLNGYNLHRIDFSLTNDLFNMLFRSMYVGAFRNALNVGTADYLDLKVGTGFIENWNNWYEGIDTVKQRKISTLIKEIGELLDLENLEVTASHDKKTLNIKHDIHKFKLDNVGSGIAQVIIVLGNIVTGSPRLVMIDEPELNLHPTLQMKFLNIIEKYCHSIIFSTHSVGLARSSAQRVYSVKKDKNNSKISEWNNENSYLEIAGELSYSAWNDMGLEKILLCEGPTEVKCFQYFLRKLKADHRVLVFPLGGSSLINGSKEKELAELLRLNKPLFCIVDSEKNAETEDLPQDRKDFDQICKKIGIKNYILTKRSMDNYLTDDAIKKVKGEKYSELSPFENLKDHSPKWQKNENHKIFEHVKDEDLEMMDFFKFIKEIVES